MKLDSKLYLIVINFSYIGKPPNPKHFKGTAVVVLNRMIIFLKLYFVANIEYFTGRFKSPIHKTILLQCLLIAGQFIF